MVDEVDSKDLRDLSDSRDVRVCWCSHSLMASLGTEFWDRINRMEDQELAEKIMGASPN
jgi:hypothetical protein